MSLDALSDLLGDEALATSGGVIIGMLFGALAQRSRFCLRAATLEVAHGRLGQRLSIWLFAFSMALIATQALILAGEFDTAAVRQLSNRGSLSGSVIGGLLFGGGMTLTRACASRMLVLSATGNLRALLSGLVFAVVAQSTRSGQLSPLRAAIGEWWIIDAGLRDLLGFFGVGNLGGLLFGGLWLLAGLWIARSNLVPVRFWLTGGGVGACVALAWWFTYGAAAVSFDPVPVHALSFASPSADTLMLVLSPPGARWTFDIGLIPGVALGAFIAGWLGKDLKLEGFNDGSTMRRYILGGCMMGFGGVLAGGCAVGAGVSGASVFASTSWLVLWSMWIGAVGMDWLVDGRKTPIPGLMSG